MKSGLYALLMLLLALFFSCKKDKVLTSSSAKLTFSQDSVLFDTVFTQIGSTTQYFRVHNRNNGIVNISSLRLARGTSSFYQLNVNGLSGQSFSNLQIAAGDSMYIFVKVTIDPNNQTNPFIYRDSILFDLNGNEQHFDLVAFGQNAYYHLPSQKFIFSSTQAFYYDTLPAAYNTTVTWPTDKPHVIYGYLVVDSTRTLIIPAGAKIYVHNNGGIWVYRYGCIQVTGTLQNPVTFQGDRLESVYQDVPGQWDRIWINEGSVKNSIEYAIIKNGYIGVQASYSVFDGLAGNVNASDPKRLYIANTVIRNCSFSGLLARYYNISGGNNVFSNCGNYLAAFQYGGSYVFDQCTFANYWNQISTGNNPSGRTTQSFYFNNYYPNGSSNLNLAIDTAYFGNCILDGTLAEEFQFDTVGGGYFNHVLFDHCLMKTSLLPSSGNHSAQCILGSSPGFSNPALYNFHLQAGSPAIGYGNTNVATIWPLDIEGNSRNLDIGAYKF